MKRVLFFLIASLCVAQPARRRPVRVDVGPGTEVTLTIPGISKEDLRSLVSEFLGKGDEKAAARFREVFAQSSALTLVVTTK